VNWLLFAQSTSSDANLAPLARRLLRGGLGTAPGSSGELLLLVLGWLAVLGIIAGLLQGDWKKWLRGLVDIRGHFEQLGAGLEIMRRNKRPLWVILAAAVMGWTGWSLGVWQDTASKDELEAMLAVHDNSAMSFAAAHGLTAAIVPLRDLVGLGDLMPLLLGACVLLFARTAELAQHLRFKTRAAENARLKRRIGTIWVGLIILAAYRALVFLVSPGNAPLADCMFINVVAMPVLTLVADGVLLSWLLTEFGRGLVNRLDWEPDDSVAFVRNVPAGMLVCALANPGRYVLVACAIAESQFNASSTWPASRWAPILWGCTIAQVCGLAWFAFPAVVAVSRRGRLPDAFRSYVMLLRRAGGQVVGLTALAILLNLLALLPFYWIFGTMQRETWSLLGAASYGHYTTLIVGIILLAGTTQLAYQELGIEEDQGPIPTLLETPVDAMAQPTGSSAL
jgi:hypothetical protein